MRLNIKALLVAMAAIPASALVAHAGAVDPAQALAQKFSEASDEKPKMVAPQRAFSAPGPDYEADMLERARSEENERATLEAKQILATPPVAAAQPAAAAVPPPSAAAVAPARAAIPQAPVQAAIPQSPARTATPQPATQAAVPQAPVAISPAPAPVQTPAVVPKVAALSPPKPTATVVGEDIPSRPSTATATVLLVLDPDGSQVGFKPDPIICMDNRCWLSNGIGAPALVMPRNKAVALPTTKDVTADSCSGKSGCVYRGVAIDPTMRLDVVEVGEAGGASAGAYTIAADKSCRKDGSSLVCENGLTTQNFRIWVVPETTAELAGASGLENAVAEGLPDPDVPSSASNDK